MNLWGTLTQTSRRMITRLSPLGLADTRTRNVISGKNEFSVMPRRHELKRLFHLLLNAALAVVSYTDLGGKAPCTRPDPLHPASTLHAHAHAHVYPLHTQARIAMLVFAIFAALDSVVAYTAPAFVLSSGAFGKAADEATDLEKSLLKLWGGAARRKVAASYRTRPPSRASFHPALYLGRWPRLYTTRRRRPTGLVTALRQREARFKLLQAAPSRRWLFSPPASPSERARSSQLPPRSRCRPPFSSNRSSTRRALWRVT